MYIYINIYTWDFFIIHELRNSAGHTEIPRSKSKATADGTQSPLIEEMRRQHVHEARKPAGGVELNQ